MEAVATLVGGVSESALFSCIQREQQRLPRASPEAVISAVAKQVVPPTVPGSPAYHRNKLQDLLAMVHRHGIPSLFLTLTADEQTALRWPEVAMLEDKAREMTGLPDLQWKDLPVEMARLFTDRVNTFMSRHVLHHAMAILGRINHWVIRYEAQVNTQLSVLLLFRGIAAVLSCQPTMWSCGPWTWLLHADVMGCCELTTRSCVWCRSTGDPCTHTFCCGCTRLTCRKSAKRSQPRVADTSR